MKHHWLRSPLGAVAVAAFLTMTAALENTVAPWAPFHVVHAALALAVPLLLGGTALGSFRRPKHRYWFLAIGLAVALHGIFGLMVAMVDLPGMFGRIFTVAAGRLAREPEAIGRAYLLFVQVWAGLGEEIFYRGYLQGTLRQRFGPLAAIAAASLLFAIRHYAQVLIVWPDVDWGSATVWVAATFVVGLAFGWLYEKSASLWPSIVCHYAFNFLA